MWRRIATACVLLCYVSTLFAQNSFLVAPTHMNVDLSHHSIRTLMVSNTSDDRIHIKIKPMFMKVASRSLQLGQALYPKQQRQYDLSRYIVISPRALSLMPGQQREVRLSIAPPKDLPKGAYRAHLLFSMLDAVNPRHKKPSKSQRKTMTVRMNMMMEMATSVYGTKGRGAANLSFVCQRSKQGHLILAVKNDSPWRFEGGLTVTPQNTSKSVPIDLVLLRDSKRQLVTLIPAKAKQYQLQWRADEPYQGRGQILCHIA